MGFSNNKRLPFLSISETLVRYARSTFHFAVSKKGLCMCDKKQMISQLAKCAKINMIFKLINCVFKEFVAHIHSIF